MHLCICTTLRISMNQPNTAWPRLSWRNVVQRPAVLVNGWSTNTTLQWGCWWGSLPHRLVRTWFCSGCSFAEFRQPAIAPKHVDKTRWQKFKAQQRQRPWWFLCWLLRRVARRPPYLCWSPRSNAIDCNGAQASKDHPVPKTRWQILCQ